MNRSPDLCAKNLPHQTTTKTNTIKTTQSVCAVAALLMAAMAPTQALTTTAAELAVLRDGDGAIIMPDEFFNMDDKTGPDMNNPKN